MVLTAHRRFWMRFLCVAVACGGLSLVLTHLNTHELLAALTRANYTWYIASALAYGFVFLPAAWRWHLALRATGCEVSLATSLRFTLIGHFLYAVFFGAVGGDTGKSVLYARWRGFPIPSVLAAAPLDRFMGSLGLIFFGALTAGLALFGAHGSALHFHAPGLGWLLLVLFCVVAAGLILWFCPAAFRRNFLSAFFQAGKKLLRSPAAAASGVFCGFLVQLALSGVFALNLLAIAKTPVPWASLAWTFPLMVIAGGIPVTVVGFGTREGAAIGLLGLYGISATDAVAMSLLAVSANLIWAALGGLVWWAEVWRERRRARASRKSVPGAANQPICDVPLLPEL